MRQITHTFTYRGSGVCFTTFYITEFIEHIATHQTYIAGASEDSTSCKGQSDRLVTWWSQPANYNAQIDTADARAECMRQQMQSSTPHIQKSIQNYTKKNVLTLHLYCCTRICCFSSCSWAATLLIVILRFNFSKCERQWNMSKSLATMHPRACAQLGTATPLGTQQPSSWTKACLGEKVACLGHRESHGWFGVCSRDGSRRLLVAFNLRFVWRAQTPCLLYEWSHMIGNAQSSESRKCDCFSRWWSSCSNREHTHVRGDGTLLNTFHCCERKTPQNSSFEILKSPWNWLFWGIWAPLCPADTYAQSECTPTRTPGVRGGWDYRFELMDLKRRFWDFGIDL